MGGGGTLCLIKGGGGDGNEFFAGVDVPLLALPLARVISW